MRCEVQKLRRRTWKAKADHSYVRWRNKYNIASKKYASAVRKAKSHSWKGFIESHTALNAWGLPYKILSGKMKSRSVLSTLQSYPHEFTAGTRDTTEILVSSLLPDDKPEEDTPLQADIRERSSLVTLEPADWTPITPGDVQYYIDTVKKRKAPGPDGIFPDVYCKVKDNISPYLAKLYTECLKTGTFPAPWKRGRLVILHKSPEKDPTLPKSYRPINLLDVGGKVFEKVLKDLTSEALSTPLAPEQFGFMQGKCTTDAILKLHQTIEAGDLKYMAALFVDISGAFDNLWWPALLVRLEEQRIPRHLYDILKDYLSQRSVEVQTPLGTYKKPVTRGCPQGSVLGPFLWNLVMDTCIQKLKPFATAVLAYADDLLVLWQCRSRLHLEEQGRVICRQLQEWCELNKLTVAPDKSALMVFPIKEPKTLRRQPIVKINGHTIPVVRETVYLGVRLDLFLHYRSHLRLQTHKAIKAVSRVASLAKRDYSLTPEKQRILYKGIFEGIALYACGVWAHRIHLKTYAMILLRAQRTALVRLFGAYADTPLEALTLILDEPPAHLTTLFRAAKYHVKRDRPDLSHELINNYSNLYKSEQKEKLVEMWDAWLRESPKGTFARAILGDVQNRKRLFWVKPNRATIRVLSGHGPFRDHLFRRRLTDSDLCPADLERDTVEHAVFRCKAVPESLKEARMKIQARTLREVVHDCEDWNILSAVLPDLVQKRESESLTARVRIQVAEEDT